jgi:monovalent cation:H+ antiporter, CPA1 family
MVLRIEIIEFLLLVAAIVAMLARRLRLPYSVGLVVAGIAISLLPGLPQIQISRELIFTILLPPLIFEASLYIRWQDLRRDFLVILAMAVVGVILSACVTALGLHYIAGWERAGALLFGVLIAATDPVSVIATFKESGIRGRLRFLLEAESLFNDGTAAAAFTIALVFVSGGSVTPTEILMTSLLTVGGGIACGVAVAASTLLLAGRTNDHLVETMLTTAGAYGSFLLAEHFHFSGVLATLAAGLTLGNVDPLGAVTEKGREAINSFWEYTAFVASSFVFLLIGMNGTKENILLIWRTALVAIPLVMIGRAAAVYLTLLPFANSSLRVSAREQHILVWGGLRGALPLALVLGLPTTIPRREEMITVTFAVVAFSVFVQGLTVVPLLRRFGELPIQVSKMR